MNLSMLRISVVAVLLLTTSSVKAQQPGAPDPLDRLGFMIGKWEGTGEGKPGRSVVRRE